ncbi:hypothetical protein ACFVMC_00185 [Nocardia sp. NPDC127579]|uniref:hypothetical protein n=1 Tax=Nocardia sp. NPDC127579 TaxID=3345402 RepID=UPI003638E896
MFPSTGAPNPDEVIRVPSRADPANPDADARNMTGPRRTEHDGAPVDWFVDAGVIQAARIAFDGKTIELPQHLSLGQCVQLMRALLDQIGYEFDRSREDPAATTREMPLRECSRCHPFIGVPGLKRSPVQGHEESLG